MINIKGSYNREFYIFEKVSNKYGIPGKEYSGYLKIETKGEKGKLKIHVENINILDNVKFHLKFYVIKNEAQCIISQIIWPVKGLIEREIDFVCNDFEGTNVSIDNIAVVAVIAEENLADGQFSRDIVLGASKKNIKEWVETIKKVEENTEPTVASRKTNRIKNDLDKNNFKEINKSKKDIDQINANEMRVNQSNMDKKDINKINNDIKNMDEINIDKINTDKIGEKFDEYFQKVDPFGTGRRDYEWWWVNNPVFLNNILYDFKIKSPLFFKPEIMDSQFKYKHIIIGIFNDLSSDESFFVYGIPGNMDYDKEPEGIHSVWIKAGFDFQGNNTFGYWLIYFEPYSGKVVNV